VLIVGTDRTSPEFDGDYDESTRHFGAFVNERNLCCLSWMRAGLDSQPAWQLRGMATHSDFRGTGVGRELLDYSENQIASESGVTQFWCNARSGAVGFYQKQVWQICSDEFVIPGVGPHFKMKKTYNPNA
ncbi:GNAT family N-acetyltransferase, partial [bacterium]|nr:GNAT family N-acetyltransferase [bacterium]